MTAPDGRTESGGSSIRVLVVAEIRLYRDGLAHVLRRTDAIDVVGTAAGRDEALAAIAATQPPIVLVDVATPAGVDAIARIRALPDPPKVVALAVPNSERDLLECAEIGVAGFVTRDDSLDAMIGVIQSVARGELLCTPRIAAALIERIAVLSKQTPPTETARLTRREQEIVGLIDDGFSNKAIAQHLRIELPTVKNHVHNILEKLQVRRRSEAAARMRASRSQPLT